MELCTKRNMKTTVTVELMRTKTNDGLKNKRGNERGRHRS